MSTGTRTQLHGMWNAVANQRAAHAEYVEAKGAALTKTMLDAAVLRPTDRVLELACGTGGLGAAAAPLAHEVVISDVAEAMVAHAAERVDSLPNVTTKVLDIEEIAEPGSSFDAVLCREGLMFATEPGSALGEIRRVLRPGGRFVAAVWGPQPENPWLGLVLEAVSAQLGRPVPPPGMPGPFSLADAVDLLDHARRARFAEAVVERLDVPTIAASFEEWWQRTAELAGPLANILPMLPDEAKSELVDRLRAAATPYTSPDGTLVFPGVSLLLTARR